MIVFSVPEFWLRTVGFVLIILPEFSGLDSDFFRIPFLNAPIVLD